MNINIFLQKLLLYVPVKMVPAVSGIFLVFFLYKSFPEGQYVSYSVGLFCSLVAAQLCAGWVGNSFIYYYSGVEDKKRFVSNCVCVILLIAPVASSLSAIISNSFIVGSNVFIYVWLLCFSQVLFFFLSSVCQAGFLVKQQLVAVVLQSLAQIVLVMLFFRLIEVNFRYALLASIAGYFFAGLFMLYSIFRVSGVCNPFADIGLLKKHLSLLYQYGAALSPWILGMLVMAGADRLAIEYYDTAHGDSYLSLKDLFVGGAGLLSMPLLMMVHPFVIKKFREGVFAIKMIESSSSFLIIVFSLLWSVLYFVGFDFFERITGKEIGASSITIFFAFAGVFLNSAAVYFQKRLEVHRKMKLLAGLSLLSALTSICFAWVGGRFWGLFGISLGVLLAQLIYFVFVVGSMYKRLDLYRSFTVPLIVSLLAFVIGSVFYQGLQSGFSSFIWWERSICWLVGFSIVSLVSLWKGVRWAEFMKATL
ncbi:sugar transporter [Pseudomonas putida]|jgi:O-antigen/teichoic acid export membrane protein|uniref:sugar transporter n=1 Tax=Pseudomonas putida TaxID=303 RepID=UPI000AD0E6E4|nr:sugar transporter [Pseudomonas putida]